MNVAGRDVVRFSAWTELLPLRQGCRVAADNLPMHVPPRQHDTTTRGLAHERDVNVGVMRLQPSLCRAEVNGETRHLEPRVTRVLLAFCQNVGAVLTRDDLTARCWDGVVVGDDAINRVIGKIRRLAERSHAGFLVETVRRVGYRLIVSETSADIEDSDYQSKSIKPLGHGRTVVPVVAVLPFDGKEGPEARSLAEGTTDCILSSLARDAGVAVVSKVRSNPFRGERKGDAARTLGANQLVDGAVSVHGDEVRIIIYLIESVSGLTLWSEQFKGTIADPFSLQQTASTKVREALIQAGADQDAWPVAHKAQHDPPRPDLSK